MLVEPSAGAEPRRGVTDVFGTSATLLDGFDIARNPSHDLIERRLFECRPECDARGLHRLAPWIRRVELSKQRIDIGRLGLTALDRQEQAELR